MFNFVKNLWHKNTIKNEPQPIKYWLTPDIDLLNDEKENLDSKIYSGESIANVITSFGVPCKFIELTAAPQITTYHFDLINAMDISKLKKPLKALEAMAHCHIQQIASKVGHFGIIIPKENRRSVPLKTCMFAPKFESGDPYLNCCLGMDCNNDSVCLCIGDMPHMLIAGATGSGKSVALNDILISMLYRSTPERLQLVMIDPKKVEFSKYDGLPFLLKPVVKDHSSAIATLQEVCQMMDDRYNTMSQRGVKNARELNLPSIVVVIDELADLMLTSKYECEESIIRIAQLGRAADIHLIIATQRPTVNVVTGLIKSNIPCKIALQTSSVRDSITILDHKGAEQLMGKGDALLKLPNKVEEIRFQSAWISDEEIERVVDYWKYSSIHTYQNNKS